MPDPPKEEEHPRPTLLSDFILGSQDGIVNVLGILLGLVAAGTDVKYILVAGLAALAAESISMGAVAYTSTQSRRALYASELEREKTEMRVVPELEREEVRVILREWGYSGEDLEDMLRRIESKPKAWLDVMMAFELKLAPVSEQAPRESAVVVGLSTLLGHVVPLLPFFVLGSDTLTAAIIAVILSGLMLFFIGFYEARTTIGSLWKSGSRMLVIGLSAGFAGFVIGWALTHL
jgi:vacuolar iron transporter family protein